MTRGLVTGRCVADQNHNTNDANKPNRYYPGASTHLVGAQAFGGVKFLTDWEPGRILAPLRKPLPLGFMNNHQDGLMGLWPVS